MPDIAEPDYALLDRAGADRVAFYPRTDHAAPPPGASDHRIPVAPGVRIGARFYVTDPARPTILYFHGNGEVASDHDDIAPFYAEIGVNLLVAEFRGYGTSNGTPSFGSVVADARAVACWFHEFLDDREFPAQRFVMGRSMGAHSALEIAANAAEGFAGLVLESAAGNLRRIAARFPLDPSAAAKLSGAHEAKIRSIRMPLLMIHGEWDELIPLATAVEIYDLLGSEDRRFLVVPGAGHNDILWVGHVEYFGAIADFIASCGQPGR